MKIGLISDTHGVFKEEWKELFSDCDYLIHAGDFASPEVYRAFRSLGIPMYMVAGNCDRGSWAQYIPETLSFRIAGKMFFLIHDPARIRFDLPGTDFIIHGHTHHFRHDTIGGITVINPGSAGSPRGGEGAGAAKLTLNEDGSYELEHLSF